MIECTINIWVRRIIMCSGNKRFRFLECVKALYFFVCGAFIDSVAKKLMKTKHDKPLLTNVSVFVHSYLCVVYIKPTGTYDCKL